MSSKRTQGYRKWYQRLSLVTIAVLIAGIIIGWLLKQDLLYGLVLGIFLIIGLRLGALWSGWYKQRGESQNNQLLAGAAAAIVIGIIGGLIAAVLSDSIEALLSAITDLVTGFLQLALDSGSSVSWGIVIAIGVAAGAAYHILLDRGDKSSKD